VVLDSPSPDLPCENKQDLMQKRENVDQHLLDLHIPLHYLLYNKGNSKYIDEMGVEKSLIIGSMIVLTPDHEALEERFWNRIFQMAAWEDLPIVINSRDENSWQHAKFKGPDETLLEKAIYYAESQNARLVVLNIATPDELDLIEQARDRSLLIYAETTPLHLFPQEPSRVDFLWDALQRGAIDIIGSGYRSDVQDQERLLWSGENFDFSNPVFLLPLLLSAYHEGKMTLENIVRVTRGNLHDIFSLEKKDIDLVLIDLEEEHVVQRVSKNQSIEMKLKGWPVYTIVKGEIFTPSKGGVHLTHVS
jgi:dihydroorotase